MKNKQAFTLIELLVVVLIIGILAAVALPQYQKAVFKSRFTQMQVVLNAYTKAVDVYILANGFPQESTDLYDLLDVSFEGKRYTNLTATYFPFGHIGVSCRISSCSVGFKDASIAGNTWSVANPSPWLQGTVKVIRQADSEKWFLSNETDSENSIYLKIICQWWASAYGVAQMEEEIKAKCAELGIN